MTSVHLSYSNMITALGSDTPSVFSALSNGTSGLRKMQGWQRLELPICASHINDDLLQTCHEAAGGDKANTRLEKMMVASLHNVMQQAQLPIDERVGLIIATTKGNVDALSSSSPFPPERAYLTELGKRVAAHFGIQTTPFVLSNACVSSLHALIVARRLIQAGTFDHVLVTSGDLLSEFVIAGFNSFQALSPEPCRPYCAQRAGINLGEAAASVLVTRSEEHLSEDNMLIIGAGSCNDANHISGPSRTGEGLFRSITQALQQAEVDASRVDLISAHGTATLYNDEMESIALHRASLSQVPMHSLKGYFGHCLGSAGLLETLIMAQSMHQGRSIASAGLGDLGVSKPLNVIQESGPAQYDVALKTASGFGGCNTAVVFRRPA